MHLNNVILCVSKLCKDGGTLPLAPASDPVSSSRLGREANGGAASAVFPKLRCPPCVPSTWSSVYAPNQHLFLCFRLKADREPVGVKPGSEASSLEVLVGRGSPSEGAVLENCPPAKLYIQVHRVTTHASSQRQKGFGPSPCSFHASTAMPRFRA